MVVAPDSDLATELVSDVRPEVRARFDQYLEAVRGTTEMDRLSTDREKTGVFLERHAVNPLTGERIPIWAADYVLSDYGHGAIMAVPAHDQRDLDFARAFDLPVRIVVDTTQPVTGAIPVIHTDPVTGEPILPEDAPLENPSETGVALTGEGRLINSGPFDGLSKSNAIRRVTEALQGSGLGAPAKNFRLRDWLISRQRYWGTPIPIIHCEQCGEVPVPESELPVLLPPADGLDLQPKGTSPLGAASDWVNVTCPSCGGAARRDTDTMDTFVDSSWYFLRFLNPNDDTQAFDPKEAEKWAPVDQYVGGVDARDPAPAVRALHHQGAVRPGLRQLHGALQRAAQPGHGADGRLRHEQVARQPGEALRAAGRARRRRGAPDHVVRRSARGRHRLGRRVAVRQREVPGARLARRARRHERARRGLEDRRPGPAPHRRTDSWPMLRVWWRRSSSTSSSRA